jgi:hypothetical protein
MKQAYFVPNFPINRITQTGEDGWCHMPNHPRNLYDYLGAILEHMDNSKRIDPIQITIHDEQQVHAGPSGVSRLFALTHHRQYTHIPCIVNSPIHYEWFGKGVVTVNTTEELLSYFDPQYLPKSYEVNENGVAWHNGAWSYEELERTMNVSEATKLRMKQMMTETN